MKQLKFEHQFAQAVKTGDKSATLRVHDDKDINVGDMLQLVDKVDRDYPTTWEVTGELHVNEIEQIALEKLSKEHFVSAESFKDQTEMLQVFRRFYGEHVSESTPVNVIHFSFVPYEAPKKFLEDSVDGNNLRLKEAKLYADGGSRGNPGPSASGFVVLDRQDKVLHTDNKYLGVTTNNQAEYHAMLSGMEWCLKQGVSDLDIYLDSMLVVNQMKGIFKVKNRDLWSLHERAKQTASKFHKIRFTHVPRELNKLADTEVNKALDAISGADVVQ